MSHLNGHQNGSTLPFNFELAKLRVPIEAYIEEMLRWLPARDVQKLLRYYADKLDELM